MEKVRNNNSNNLFTKFKALKDSKNKMLRQQFINRKMDFERNYYNIPKNSFVFLLMLDTKRGYKGTNPCEAIAAFKRAFSKQDTSVSLVISISKPNGQLLTTIEKMLDGYNNYIIIKKALSKNERKALFCMCDIFLSLTRRNLFDSNILQAMSLKTTVIASYNTKNSKFISPQTACCVDYQTINSCKKKTKLYEPDLIQAAVFMKILKVDGNYRKMLSENAFCLITKNTPDILTLKTSTIKPLINNSIN